MSDWSIRLMLCMVGVVVAEHFYPDFTTGQGILIGIMAACVGLQIRAWRDAYARRQRTKV